jgi:signal transduction histidine kinase
VELQELGESASGHLYRIAQEAVANAIKHGGATRILIRLRRHNQQVRLSVTDNGSGIAPGIHSDGMGVHLMSYRARLAGGDLAISPARGGGTQVTCICGLTVASPPRSAQRATQPAEARRTH